MISTNSTPCYFAHVPHREEFQKWKQQGSDLLAQLEDLLSAKIGEIELLTSEVEELREEIAELRSSLPRSAPRTSEPVGMRAVLQGMPSMIVRPPEVPADASIINLVRAALMVADGPEAAKVVCARVNGLRDTSPADVHRALYRLKEAGEVEVTGERPNSLYALKPEEPEKQTALPMAK
ncbi:MAG TPA: hypothetical protein VFG23_14560 [Polyangia bacterium]|nr:hypothetical protein [Polyangia bacterium]